MKIFKKSISILLIVSFITVNANAFVITTLVIIGEFIASEVASVAIVTEAIAVGETASAVQGVSSIVATQGIKKGVKSTYNSITNKQQSNASQNSTTQISIRRRITNLEKHLMTSNQATKIKIFGRTIVKRNILQCNKSNIALMLNGNAPFGYDSKRVELHHLKQQKNGNIIELTQTEHNKYSKVLHRYVRKGSNITDRNTNFAKFRKQYWKSRASGCISKR